MVLRGCIDFGLELCVKLRWLLVKLLALDPAERGERGERGESGERDALLKPLGEGDLDDDRSRDDIDRVPIEMAEGLVNPRRNVPGPAAIFLCDSSKAPPSCPLAVMI